MREALLSASPGFGQTAVYYTGQMGFILKHAGKYLIIDGYLSDYVDRNCSGGSVKWHRKYAPPILPRELDFVDYVFCTHAHLDHTDPDTAAGLAAVNDKARFIAPPPAADLLEESGIAAERIRRVKPGAPFKLCGDISVTVFPAAHEALHKRNDGSYDEVGYRIALGDVTFAHTGDCCPYNGLTDTLRGVDVLAAPVNGRDDYRTEELGIIGCFTGEEALSLAENAGVRLLIPGHFDLYDVNGADPGEFLALRDTKYPNQRVKIFAPGEGITIGPAPAGQVPAAPPFSA